MFYVRPAVALLSLGLALTVLSHTVPKPQSAAPAPGTPGIEAMRVAIDPETGTLVPVRPEADAKRIPAANRSHEGLEQVIHPDGRAHVDLQGRFQCYATATVGADGEVQTHYNHGSAPSPSQPAIEE